MRSRLCLLCIGFTLMLSSSARADDDTEVTPDKYSKTSEQKLMLTGDIKFSIPEPAFRKMYADLGFNRFNMSVKTNDPNDPKVEAWCEAAIKDTQTRRDEVDGETGDAVVTLKAKIERCSQVFLHDINVTHSCERVQPKKGAAFMSCKVVATATITKFKADQSSGKLRYVVDAAFGQGGKITKQTDSTGTGTLKDRGRREAEEAAMKSGASTAGLLLKRALRDIKEFQLSTPVIRSKGGIAYGCLARDTTELDTPFHIIFKSPSGEKRTGFVKARRIFDGCTETPSMREEMKKGKKYEVKPFEAQIIRGGSDIKPGHTFWEMPSIGLNIGGYAGISGTVGFFDGNVGPGGGLAVEFNLAPYLGVSELHVFLNGTFLANTDDEAILKAFEGSGLSTEGSPFGIQIDLGVLKRFYFAGPLFADLGLALAYSSYSVTLTNAVDEQSAGLGAIGAAAHGGIGYQLSPRLLMRFNVGFRVGIAMASATDRDGDDITLNTDPAAELGPFARLTFLYNL